MAGKKGQKVKKAKEDSKKFPEYYKKANPTWSSKECEEAAKHFRKCSNWLCIEYYETKYPELSHEEHLKMKAVSLRKKKENNKLNFEYYLKNYPDLSESELKEIMRLYTAKQNFLCIEYYKLRNPELSDEECEKLRKTAIKDYTSKRNTFGENNPMHHSKVSYEQRKYISPYFIEFYEKRYPESTHEEHVVMRDNFFKKNTESVKAAIKTNNIEYYLNQGMPLEKAQLALKNRLSTFSLKTCIEKYGETEGLKRFNDRQNKWLLSLTQSFELSGDNRTPISKFEKECILNICKLLKINFPKKQKYLTDTNKLHFSYDFNYKKKLIEFHGDYWHCNPKVYNLNYFNKRKAKTAKEIWEYDAIKKECAEQHGYQLLTIWELDYKENPQQEIQKCLEFLND